MTKQLSYIKHYLCALPLLVSLTIQANERQAQVTQIKAADNTPYTTNAQKSETGVALNQAELDQLLAPIALYPDTLLSHILVAATYPLEIIQAARWRAANEKLDEQEALNAVEDKDWDPSVKALIPFNDLLQRFSADLDWLQSLGDAFLNNEEQVLTSVQKLRQKAYAIGNLQNNEYVEINQDDQQISIQPVNREFIYVPYYDTRVVYGRWWWDEYQPYYWHNPSYYVMNSGFYWSPMFHISPTFYFGGFRWREHYIYADYAYRTRVHRTWNASNRQVVNNREYSRWQHNAVHRRGVHYTTNNRAISRDYGNLKTNPNRYVTHTTESSGQKRQQIDKQRILDIQQYQDKKEYRSNRTLHDEKGSEDVQQALKNSRYNSNTKQREVNRVNSQQRPPAVEKNQQEDQADSRGQRIYKQQPQSSASRSTTVNNQQVINAHKKERAPYKRQEQNQTFRQRETSQNNTRNERNDRSSSSQQIRSKHTERRAKE